jgi:hypothetical protein
MAWFSNLTERFVDAWGPGIVQDLRFRRDQHEPWPGMGDVNETAEPYRVFPGLVVAETLGA